MRRRQALFGLSAGLLILASCGGSDTSSGSSSATAVEATAESTTAEATTASSDAEATADGTTAAPSATEAPSGDAITPPDPGAASGEACSTDGAPTELSPLDGDLPDVPVDAAFEQSPLPNVSLRRINCAPAYVNLKNEAPGELPVLYWFWAPF